MKTLVTGGTGFTGSHLVKQLLARGDEVRVLDNKPGLFARQLASEGAEIAQGCVSDAKLVDDLVKGCDVVFHLAAAFREMKAPRSYYRTINIDGTENVAASAKRHGVRRLVHCSTCGVHGNIDQPPADEQARIAPEDYYQYTKYLGEEVVQRYVAKGLDAVIVRPAAIYGPGDPERFGILFRLVQRGKFWMFGSGRTFYHPLYIDNLIDALLKAADVPEGRGQAYLIADQEYWSLNDLVTKVADSLRVRVDIVHLPFWPLWCSSWLCQWACKPFRLAPPIFPRRVAWFRQDRAFSIEKARRELGYEPKVGIDEGLARTAAWLKKASVI